MKIHPLITKVQKKQKNAYKYFCDEVELDEAETLVKTCEAYGDTVTADVIEGYIIRYNETEETEETEAEEPVKKAPKGKAKKGKAKKGKAKKVVEPEVKTATPYAPYHNNGGLGMLDYYADEADFEFDSMKMVSSRIRVKRGSSNEVRAKYLQSLWHASIDLARENGEENWFTRIVRHQISALIKGDARKKYLKGIPLPRDA